MDKIRITKKITTDVPLLRVPTPDEYKMISDGEMFDIEGLFDWDNEETVDEDYSYARIDVTIDNKIKLHIDGKYS